jgi:uncharacterized membrane protein YphA (DoxX/SURF4 family)/thiol-disulfide isomerase/thioredoxin
MDVRIDTLLRNRWFLLALRLALGGIFIAASVPKLQHQVEFVNTVVAYGILPDVLAEAYGLAVPWVELFVGCCLVLGIFIRFATAPLGIPLIISFVVASTYSLINPTGESCGCFGELITLNHQASLSLDVVMLSMSLLILLNIPEKEFLSLGPLLSRYNPFHEKRRSLIFLNASKLAVVAVAMVLVVPFIEAVQSPTETGINTAPESSITEEASYRTEIDMALEQDTPVFLFFYISGCPPCEEQHPIIDALASEYGDRVHFMDILMGGSPVLLELRVGDSPTMLLVTGKDSRGNYTIYRRFVGVTDIEILREGLDKVLRSGE